MDKEPLQQFTDLLKDENKRALVLDKIIKASSTPPPGLSRPASSDAPAPGYERLWDVLKGAHDQAALGKGKVRHASGEPFHEQPIVQRVKRYGMGSALAQVEKKINESLRLERQAAIHELRGAINYAAAVIIYLEDGADEGSD